MAWFIIGGIIIYLLIGLGLSFIFRGPQGGSVDTWKDRLILMIKWPLFFKKR